MRAAQKQVAEFNQKRGWKADTTYLKDFLLNICEETGEAWNIIKWVDADTQKRLIEEHKAEFKDFIGDELYLMLKVAYLLDVDAEECFQNTMREYETRFPADKMRKVKHGNPLAGGIDDKHRR